MASTDSLAPENELVTDAENELVTDAENELVTDAEDIKTQVIVNDDCIKQMKEMDSDSADIIICDPPYNIGKDFGNSSDKQDMDKYLEWCDEWIGECIRVVKPKGTLYIRIQ